MMLSLTQQCAESSKNLQSAKRTAGTSPALECWGSNAILKTKPMKRALDTEPLAVASGSRVQLSAAGKKVDYPSTSEIELLTRLLPQAVLYCPVVRFADSE